VPVITDPARDITTGDCALTLAGTAIPGSEVEVFDWLLPVGRAVSDRAGRWSACMTSAGPGRHMYAARTVDSVTGCYETSGRRMVIVDPSPVTEVRTTALLRKLGDIGRRVHGQLQEVRRNHTSNDGGVVVEKYPGSLEDPEASPAEPRHELRRLGDAEYTDPLSRSGPTREQVRRRDIIVMETVPSLPWKDSEQSVAAWIIDAEPVAPRAHGRGSEGIEPAFDVGHAVIDLETAIRQGSKVNRRTENKKPAAAQTDATGPIIATVRPRARRASKPRMGHKSSKSRGRK